MAQTGADTQLLSSLDAKWYTYVLSGATSWSKFCSFGVSFKSRSQQRSSAIMPLNCSVESDPRLQ